MHKPAPQLKEIKIEVTHACLLACVHCSSNSGPASSISMSREDCLHLIQDAYEMHVASISFSGGEPLIWPYIFDAVEYASSRFNEVSIYSSGNVDNNKEHLLMLKSRGASKAIFSLYSAHESDHEWITRKKGSFELTLDSIRTCNEIGLQSEIHFVATSKNYQDLKELCKLANKLEIQTISVLRLVPQGRGRLLNGELSKQESIQLIKAIKDLRKEGFNIRTGSPMNVFGLNEDPQCQAAIDRLIISPDMSIYPCDAFKNVQSSEIVDEDPFSNVAAHTLEECWRKSKYLNEIRSVLSSAPEPPCSKCDNIFNCDTGCLAQKYLHNGVLNRSQDPACLRKSDG